MTEEFRIKCTNPDCDTILELEGGKEAWAGHVVKCPECGSSLSIPFLVQHSPSGSACPSCGNQMPSGVNICGNCMCDIRTGRKIVEQKTQRPSIARGSGAADIVGGAVFIIIGLVILASAIGVLLLAKSVGEDIGTGIKGFLLVMSVLALFGITWGTRRVKKAAKQGISGQWTPVLAKTAGIVLLMLLLLAIVIPSSERPTPSSNNQFLPDKNSGPTPEEATGRLPEIRVIGMDISEIPIVDPVIRTPFKKKNLQCMSYQYDNADGTITIYTHQGYCFGVNFVTKEDLSLNEVERFLRIHSDGHDWTGPRKEIYKLMRSTETNYVWRRNDNMLYASLTTDPRTQKWTCLRVEPPDNNVVRFSLPVNAPQNKANSISISQSGLTTPGRRETDSARHHDSTRLFSYAPPEGWVVKPGYGRNQESIIVPPGSGNSPTTFISVVVESGTSAQQVADEVVNEAAGYDGMAVQAIVPYRTQLGLYGRKVIINENSDRGRIESTYYVFVRHGTAILMIAYCPIGDVSIYREFFNSVAQSFRFEK